MSGHLAVFVAQSPDRAHREIRIYIHAAQGRQLLSAINISASDAQARAMVGEFALGGQARIMRIFDHWIEQVALSFLLFEFMKAFANAPAVITPLYDQIYFLPFVL